MRKGLGGGGGGNGEEEQAGERRWLGRGIILTHFVKMKTGFQGIAAEARTAADM